MTKRLILAAAVLGLGLSTALGQADVVRERAMLMYEQGEAFYATLNSMARGRMAYDQAKVDAAMKVLLESAEKLQTLYPPNARGQSPEADYFANAKAFENKADFDARLAKMKAEIVANAPKAKSLDGLKEAVGAIGQTCSGCHELYRAKKG
ncbi:c-type cytochrome [Rhodoplanes azumiensis]|uniref:C-type cytochrome n=1 Tax=Rhodoplanes azumiensis TaxID=1897628 RepID=A0ABW5APP7_9BRAD